MNFNSNKFVRRMFRRIDGLVWDIASGKVGLRTEHGIHSVNLTGEQPVPEVNPFDFGAIEIPAFATQVARTDIKKGDLIVGDKDIIGWVVDETLPVALRVMDHNGTTKTFTPPTVAVMGTQGILVVQNLFNLAGGEAGGAALANNMLPFLMMDGGDSKLESMLPFLLMQSTGPVAGAAAAGGGMNPLMLMAMMSDKGGSGGGLGGLMENPLMMMAMMGGMGGGAGGMNPMMMMALMSDKGIGSPTTAKVARGIPVVGSSVPPLSPRFG